FYINFYIKYKIAILIAIRYNNNVIKLLCFNPYKHSWPHYQDKNKFTVIKNVIFCKIGVVFGKKI
ncbi:hypothetical protein, partial [Bacillus wiedmannii]|uniref:hypothetical protein n=1 Tax=Bacillus wiedmannii TaxID=1890302 RepID=UPI001C3F39F9